MVAEGRRVHKTGWAGPGGWGLGCRVNTSSDGAVIVQGVRWPCQCPSGVALRRTGSDGSRTTWSCWTSGGPGGSLGSHIQLFSMSRGSNGPSERASIHAQCAHMSLRAIKRKSWRVLLEAPALMRGEQRKQLRKLTCFGCASLIRSSSGPMGFCPPARRHGRMERSVCDATMHSLLIYLSPLLPRSSTCLTAYGGRWRRHAALSRPLSSDQLGQPKWQPSLHLLLCFCVTVATLKLWGKSWTFHSFSHFLFHGTLKTA